MQCRNVLARIDALRTRELAPIEQTAVEAHLKTCRSCGDSCDDIDHLAEAVKSLAAAPVRSCCDAVKEKVADGFARVDTPRGNAVVAFSPKGIRMIRLDESLDALRADYGKRFGRVLEARSIPDSLRRQVISAVMGEGVDKPALDLDALRDLEHDVLQTLLRIPRGEVRTYAWVARQAGRPRAVRAVANVIASNVVPFIVPCHRVVPSSGGVGRYYFGSEMKRELLRDEGVDVDQLDDLAREHIRFIGSKTTHVFCFPTCRGARQIREENRVPFRDADDALESGYRPCRLCQPVVAA